MQREKAVQAVAVIVVLTVAGKFLGFIREVIMASYFGAGAVTDAYLTSTLVIALILNMLGGRALGTALIPVYCEIAAAGAEERAGKFAGTVLILTFIIFFAAALLGFAFASLLVNATVPGLPAQTKGLAVHLTRLFMAGIPMLALGGVLASLLNAHYSFAVPAALGIPHNLAIIGFVVFSGAGAVDGLAAGTLAGYLAQVLVTLPALKRKQVRITGGLDCREPGVARMGRLLLPVMAGGAVMQLNPLISRFLASGLPEGTISALSYADRIVQVLLGLLVTAIITVSYPALSREFVRERRGNMAELINSWGGMLLFVTAPLALAMASLSRPLVQVIYERGAFGSDAAGATAGALLFYSLGLPFTALGRFFTRVFYIYHDSKTPVLISMAAVAINVMASLALVKPMGHCGLALASTISAAAGVPLSLVCLKAKTGPVFNRRMWKKVLLIISALAAAALVMVVVSAAAGGAGKNGHRAGLLYLVLVGGAGMTAYFFSAHILKMEEAVAVTATLKKVKIVLRRKVT
ncbi:MAG: murein biosynthesis integral membrane protein MurJ [Pelotomaculum sp.]|uniref:Probable lipid II flippase MurJ n=1 Tax=Pelotomaculum thermopropionicum (strain DSM 13744 / JCM 10971 / SI) TaxID=370438 RepID=A5D388_PELTS|nr:murein biosynthesis integral membrane protein MurJ [Pelotomaculum sp.]BAF59289.1 Uncharacterized membrane protein [Pelotomaculum thermopropionicum SI]